MIQWTGDNLAEVLAYTGLKEAREDPNDSEVLRVWDGDIGEWVRCVEHEWIHRVGKHLGVFQAKTDGRF